MEKLLVLTAGIGKRMESYSNQINKSLLPIGGKAIISHIIENCDVDEVIVAVGYKSQQVIDYCKVLHKKIPIKFIVVDNYDKPGSGPGYSMYCCKQELQCPFYISTADSFVQKKLPKINCNWVGIAKVDGLENYSTCKVEKNRLIDFKNKSKESYDFAYTGIAAIKDYEKFWIKFEKYKKTNNDKEVENVVAFYKPFFSDIYAKKISWIDVGRKPLYEKLNQKTKGIAFFDLKKINIEEFTYKVEDKIAKIGDIEKIKKKKNRALLLKETVGKIIENKYENIICHKFIPGKTLYEIDNFLIFKEFLSWLEKTLFTYVENTYNNFYNDCNSFYKNKTYKRIKDFLSKNPSYEKSITINNIKVGKIYTLLEKISWDEICKKSICARFHGDLNFGNAIYTEAKTFKLIDWRSDFEGSLLGDSYYDLAKLYAGTNMHFGIANAAKYPFKKTNNSFVLKDFITDNTSIFLSFYENWLANKYDLKHVKILAAFSYVNMAPLHPDEFGRYLFLKGFLELFNLLRS